MYMCENMYVLRDTHYNTHAPQALVDKEMTIPMTPSYIAKVVLESTNARMPKKAHVGDAGYDLYSAEDFVLEPHTRRPVSTDIRLLFDKDMPVYGRVAPRSGIAMHFGVDVLAGVVDKSYEGIVKVILYNTGSEPVAFEIGDRIAQLIFEVYNEGDIIEATEEDEKTAGTMRGSSGFGQSGR